MYAGSRMVPSLCLFFFFFKGDVDCVNVGGKTIEKNLTQLY